MFKKLSMKKLELNGKRVFMRLDFDVPIENCKVQCNRKIVDALETIMLAIGRGAKAVIMASHVGCPEGRRIERFSLKPVAKEIQELLKRRVEFLPDCVGTKTELFCADPAPGSLIMLENLRFCSEEEGFGKDCSGTRVRTEPKRILAFRESLSRLADVYVNEAFPYAHLNNSSILGDGYPQRAAGLLFYNELRYFSKTMNEPIEPTMLIIGGKRFCEKQEILNHIIECVPGLCQIVIGGAVALTMLKVCNKMETGIRIYPDLENEEPIRKIMEIAKKKKIKIHFPLDFVVADCTDGTGKIEEASVETGIPSNLKALDIGPKTIQYLEKPIMKAKTIIWNGPVGFYETDAFSCGTKKLIDLIAKSAGDGGIAMAVGDDTACALRKWNKEESVSHISIGGETGVKLLEGKDLPGILSLNNG